MSKSHKLLDQVKGHLENIVRNVCEVGSGRFFGLLRSFFGFSGAVEGEFVNFADGDTN